MLSQLQVNEITKFFFTFQLVNKLYHWNTNSYARHVGSDRLNGTMNELVDKFIEVLIGRYKIKPYVNSIKIASEYINDDGIIKLYEQGKKYLETFQTNTQDTELLNIRDEMLGEINKNLYLFTLK
jgi:hypothetical protein